MKRGTPFIPFLAVTNSGHAVGTTHMRMIIGSCRARQVINFLFYLSTDSLTITLMSDFSDLAIYSAAKPSYSTSSINVLTPI